MACEAFFRSTEKSRAKYKAFIDKQKQYVNDMIKKYNTYLDHCDALANQMTKENIHSEKEIAKYIRKHGRDLMNEFMRARLPMDPMDIIDIYKRAIKSLRYKADRKSPEMEEALAAINHEISQDGEIYKALKTIKDRMEGKVAQAGPNAARTAQAQQAAMMQMMAQQQMMDQMNRQMQEQIQLQVQEQIQQQIQMQMMQQIHMQAHMTAMGMM